MIPRDPAIPRDLVEKSRKPAGLKKRGIWSTVTVTQAGWADLYCRIQPAKMAEIFFGGLILV